MRARNKTPISCRGTPRSRSCRNNTRDRENSIARSAWTIAKNCEHRMTDLLLQHIPRGQSMNWDRIEGNWKQMKGSIKEKWGKLTDDDFDTMAGKRDKLVGKIQERYGCSRD